MRRNDNVIRDNHAESDNIKADEIRDNHTESGNIIENNIKNNRNIKYLAGTEKIKVQPLASFDADVCEFLDVLSKEILKDINLETTLGEQGVKEEDVEWMAENCLKVSAVSMKIHPKEFNLEDIKRIYKKAL